MNQKISSFVTARKITDRRRAQRILDEGRYIPEDTSALPMAKSTDTVNPIETVKRRSNGHQVEHSPVRSSRKKKVVHNVQSNLQTAPISDRPAKPLAANPFASFDPATYL